MHREYRDRTRPHGTPSRRALVAAAVPRRRSDPRPGFDMQMGRALLGVLAIAMVLSLLPASAMAEEPPAAVSAAEWDVLADVNRLRSGHGLAPLRMAPGVREVARDRAGSMKRLRYFGHVSPTGQDAGDLLRGRSVRHRLWGEVIGRTLGMGLGPASRWMVGWWKRSPVHRDLMLGSRFDAAGVGAIRDGRRVLWTIVFVG